MEHLELSAHLEPSENIWNHQRTSGTIRKHLEFSDEHVEPSEIIWNQIGQWHSPVVNG
jgi:hypothetical protein